MRNIHIVRLFRFVVLLTFLINTPGVSHATEPPITIAAAGPVATAFLWATTPCDAHLIPDTPARAFRRADGTIVVVASHYTNWILAGHSIDTLQPQCSPVLTSSETQGGLLWIEAIFSKDGQHLDGLATRAIPDIEHQGCKSPKAVDCWLNDLVAVTSDNGGETFSVREGVASVKGRYDPAQKNRVGFFTTTNIAFRDGFYYAMFFYQMAAKQDGEDGAHGNCLVRTANIGDPASWRAWDGRAFGRVLRNVDAREVPCDPIAPLILSHEARSISYVTERRRWVVVFADRVKLPGDAAAIPGFYMSSSSDLIHWMGTIRLMEGHQQREPGGCNDFVRYPSLIDPHSRSRNYDTIDSSQAYLFFTYNHLKNCMGTFNRDLNYLPVQMTR